MQDFWSFTCCLPLNSWLIMKMQPAYVIVTVITLADVHLNWLNWFHFLILEAGLRGRSWIGFRVLQNITKKTEHRNAEKLQIQQEASRGTDLKVKFDSSKKNSLYEELKPPPPQFFNQQASFNCGFFLVRFSVCLNLFFSFSCNSRPCSGC